MEMPQHVFVSVNYECHPGAGGHILLIEHEFDMLASVASCMDNSHLELKESMCTCCAKDRNNSCAKKYSTSICKTQIR